MKVIYITTFFNPKKIHVIIKNSVPRTAEFKGKSLCGKNDIWFNYKLIKPKNLKACYKCWEKLNNIVIGETIAKELE